MLVAGFALLPALGRGLVGVGIGSLLALALVHAGAEKLGSGLRSIEGGDGPGGDDPSVPLSRGEKIAVVGSLAAIAVGLPLLLTSRTGVASRRRLLLGGTSQLPAGVRW